MNAEQKLDLLLKEVGELKQYLAANDVRIETLQKRADSHSEKIEGLEKNQYKVLGGLSIVGLASTAFFSWIFKTRQ